MTIPPVEELVIPEDLIEALELEYVAVHNASKSKAAKGSGCTDTECRYACFDYLKTTKFRQTNDSMGAFNKAGTNALRASCKKILKAYHKFLTTIKELDYK